MKSKRGEKELSGVSRKQRGRRDEDTGTQKDLKERKKAGVGAGRDDKTPQDTNRK